jgi:hypothetical protein
MCLKGNASNKALIKFIKLNRQLADKKDFNKDEQSVEKGYPIQ